MIQRQIHIRQSLGFDALGCVYHKNSAVTGCQASGYLVYTVIDAFVSTDNVVMEYVLAQSRNWEYGYSAALAWIYFAIVGACLGIICVIINRFVYYEND